MSELASLFLNNLFPIFLSAGAGYVLGKRLNIDPRPLSRIIFYIFSPCLLFQLITSSQLGGLEILKMFAFTSLLMVFIGGLVWTAGRMIKLERRLLVAVLLTSILMNAGNFGLPVSKFAFGAEALAYASLFFVSNVILTYTVGVFVASMGSTSLGRSFAGIFKIPMIYALVIALLFVSFKWTVPLPLERAITLLGDASIPSMLVLLGLQFQRSEWEGQFGALALASGARLIVAPVLAFGLSLLWGFQGPARQASILEAGMPSAVLTTILATEYDVEPSFVSTVVFVSTLISPFTLTPILALLS